MSTLIRALYSLADWESGWSIPSVDDVPEYGDIRDTWTPHYDSTSKQTVYMTEEIFDKKYVSFLWGPSNKDKKLFTKVELPVSSLVPAQEFVLVGGLDRKVKSTLREDPPTVVLWQDGRLILLDHTRVVADIVRGKTAVVANVIGLNSKGEARRVSPEEIGSIKA